MTAQPPTPREEEPVMSQSSPIPVTAWREEAQRRGGGNILDCRFRCLSCGYIFTPSMYAAAGGEARRAPQECFGRAPQGKARQHVDGNTCPCNWATYGLFRLDGLVEVQFEDGSILLVWPFAT